MRVRLEFDGGKGTAKVFCEAESDAEKAILAFMSEGHDRRWRVSSPQTYRASGVDKVELRECPTEETTK